MLKSFLPTGADASQQWLVRVGVAGGAILAYLVLALVLGLLFGEVYTVQAMVSKTWWLFAPVAVLLGLGGFVRSAGWSVAGFLLAVVIGEMIGSPIYQFQAEYLAAQLRDPHYVQDWNPVQPAFWIALLLYWYITVAATVVEYREKVETGVLAEIKLTRTA